MGVPTPWPTHPSPPESTLYLMSTKRRTFLQQVALASAATQAEASAQTPAPPAAPDIPYPRVFTARHLTAIAFPLGGVAAGAISLGGRGQLRDWEIFNRADKGNAPNYAFPAIWVQSGARKPVARVLESRIQPPYEGATGLGSKNAPGLVRLASATFTGEFPLARIDFADPALPVCVSLEAFTPFIPHQPHESGPSPPSPPTTPRRAAPPSPSSALASPPRGGSPLGRPPMSPSPGPSKTPPAA